MPEINPALTKERIEEALLDLAQNGAKASPENLQIALMSAQAYKSTQDEEINAFRQKCIGIIFDPIEAFAVESMSALETNIIENGPQSVTIAFNKTIENGVTKYHIVRGTKSVPLFVGKPASFKDAIANAKAPEKAELPKVSSLGDKI